MENITASEIAGFGVGTLLLCATIAAPRIDAFISASQRRYVFFLFIVFASHMIYVLFHLVELILYGSVNSLSR